MKSEAPPQIKRFRRSERLVHWALATPFLVCLTTAAVLVLVYNPHPDRPYREIVSWVHRISGLSMIGLPLLALLFNWRDFRIHISNIREAWRWDRDDFKWLVLMGPAMVSKKVELPEEGKFNAGEKLNFMMSMVNHPAFAISGIALWVANGALIPWVIHFALAIAALPLVAGHVFMATVNPASRIGLSGMVTGFVDRSWAKHHYRRWFREQFEKKAAVVPKGSRSRELTRGISAVKMEWPMMALMRRAMLLGMLVALPTVTMCAVGGFIAPQSIVPAVPRFLANTEVLHSLPTSDSAPVLGRGLERGARVMRFDEVNAFALVRDARGRAGYVPGAALIEERPDFDPAAFEFPDCTRTYDEHDGTPCQGRAQEMADACHVGCPEADREACATLCDSRYKVCFERCDVPINEQLRAEACEVCSGEKPNANATAAATTKPALEGPVATPKDPTPKKKRKRKRKRRR